MNLVNDAAGAIFHGFWWDKMIIPCPRGPGQCFRMSIYGFICVFQKIVEDICIFKGLNMYVYLESYFSWK